MKFEAGNEVFTVIESEADEQDANGRQGYLGRHIYGFCL